ncbi:MAG TPA: radical SAM protein [Pseudomonadota bacterium]|nr:radical SAM protein [Pseudomonadota bacterium]
MSDPALYSIKPAPLPSQPLRIAIQAVTPTQLAQQLPVVPLEEARRVIGHVFRGGKLGEPIANVRRTSIAAVAAAYHIPTLEVCDVRRSEIDPFVKFLFRTHDDKLVEAVRIPLEKPGRYSVCVSSQVGCALACAFCATGRMGLRRNLEAWEIVEQVRIVQRSIPKGEGRVHGIVFQGMGEAMANLDRVLAAIAMMSEPAALAVDMRTFTVSTAGLPTGIRRLAAVVPKVRLAVSIGSARPEVRRRIMPIDAAHSLAEVMDAGVEHAQVTGLSPLWAVTLLQGVNDTPDDAHALGMLAQDFTRRSGHRPRVSIIPYNAIDDGDADPFLRTTDEAEHGMREILSRYGVFAHRRYSGGSDVAAACGQLAAKPTVSPAQSLQQVGPE